jgi:hypothetical protein
LPGHLWSRYVAASDPDSFLLIDCGAWIERVEWLEGHARVVADSCHLGVLSDGEIRIYQLDPWA